jgi:DNA recombination protein RmuC
MPEFFQNPSVLSALIAFIAGIVLAVLFLMIRISSLKSTLAEREKSANRTIADLEADEASYKAEIAQLRSSEASLFKSQSELETRLENQRQRNAETLQLLGTVEERFTNTFKALSTDALKLSQQQFLQLAKSTFQTEQKEAKGELEKREQAVAHLVKPVAESLEKMQARIGEIEKAREGAYASIREQVISLTESQRGLHKETRSLVKALRQPTGRGQWGEMQLQRVVEMAGMQQHCDFTTQTSKTTDEGKRLRPDLIVRLPGGKQIVVDSKAPMDAYLDAIESESDADRDAALIRHANQVSTHIRQLASKNYQSQFQPAPEFVVLFLPSESFFSAALNQDSSLLEQGVDQNVILATPTTLIALLRSVAYGWRQEILAENARRISDTGRELHKRLTVFAGHLSKVGTSLEGSVKSYNSAVSSLESRVLPTARKFEALEASEQSLTLESPNDIDLIPKQPRGLPEPDEDAFEGFVIEDEAGDQTIKAESAANDFRAALED